jgi:transglutaminase-like putative cysteine protease/ketosteroid isomerase-like protein
MRFRQSLLICLLVPLFVATAAAGQVSEGEFTYAVEMNGVTCGYTDVHLSSVAGEDGPYTLLEQKTFAMQSALGSEFNTTVDLRCHIDPVTGDFSFMRMHLQQADFVLDSEIRIEGATAHCTSTLLDEETIVTLPEGTIIGNPLYSLHVLRDFVRDGAREKTYSSFDARDFKVDEITFTWVGRETLELAGRRYDAFIVDFMSHATGVKVRTWLDATNGMTLKTAGPQGLSVYLADPSVRKQIELVNVDENIIARTNVSIPDVTRISYMKVRAVLEPTGQWLTPDDLNVPGQRFTGTVTDNLIEGVFEIEHPHYDGAGAPPYPAPPVDDDALGEYLEPGAFIESGDAVLIAKARELTEGAADSWDAACRLSRWVADNITYEIPGGGSARRTYDMRAGECGSHSILLATFCRAVGIPARVVWGCMYSPDFGGAFGQHGWTEVHMGAAGWIPVDSTAHECSFVDSGHIRLGEHKSLTTALNAKSMEVLDYRVESPIDDGAAPADDGPYAAYLGKYDPPDGGEPFTVLTAQGSLAIDIPGKMVLTFKDADETGRWFCTLSNNLFVTFERGDADQAVAFRLHELVRMRRIADPDAIGDDVPDALRPYLGDYRFPGRPEPFTISCDDGRLAARYESRQSLVHMDPTDEEGRWIDEYGGNFLTFDADDEGRISALILEVVSTFRRGGVSASDRSAEPVSPAQASATNDIDTVLDDFHRAASNADFDGYFACLAPGCVFIGTDATERWTIDDLRALVKPHFDQGRARARTPRDRHIDLCPDGNVAYFDELLEIETLGQCRGTGVVTKVDNDWLIAQYSLSFPVPNEIAFDVLDRIREHHQGRDASTVTDDGGIWEALEAYLAAVSVPDPRPVDPGLFAADIEALWSNGVTYRGREAVARALQESQTELMQAFTSFSAGIDDVRIRRRDDVAWVSCTIAMTGTLAEGGGPFTRTVRSTFAFEQQGQRWRMTQEHSSRLADDQPHESVAPVSGPG